MIHSSNYKPKIMSILADLAPVEIDRLQELTGTVTLNRTKIEEVGRDGIVDWKKSNPSISLTLRQLEYGSLELYRKLAGVSNAVVTIQMTDYKTSKSDIAGYKTDDSGTFLGTIWYPDLRLSSMGLTIGDPDALIERSFTLVGEDEVTFLNDNKYLIYKRYTLVGTSNETISISGPTPVVDPDNSGQYILRVVKSSAGVHTQLTHGTQWSYDGAGTITINGVNIAGDVIRVWYSAGSYATGETVFTQNDTDLAGINADSCSIYLESSNYLYRLQSVGVDTTLDRFDVREIGNKGIVARGIRDVTNRITLGRILEAYTIEEVLRGKAGLSYGKIDVRELGSNLNLIIKVYEDNTKTTFKIGYKYIDLAPTGFDAGTPVNTYITRGCTLEGETGFVTDVEAVL